MLLTGVIIFFIGVIFIISYPINKKKNSRCTSQTYGVLAGIQPRYNSKGTLKDAHIYTYEVDGIEYQLKTTEHSQQANRVGDTCTIWYNPTKPEDAQAFQGSDKYLKKLLLIGIVMVLLGIVLTCYGFAQQFIL